MKIIKPNTYTAGQHKITNQEEMINDFKFKVHKFNQRKKPDNIKNIIIIPSFSEFGCETVSVVYCIPKLLKKYAGKYTIVLGWHGREFFYRHLVDEFWEISEDHMWLREYCRAFNHASKNLKNLETAMESHGKVINISELSNIAVFPILKYCINCSGKIIQTEDHQVCNKCKVIYDLPGLFSNIEKSKKEAIFPKINKNKIEIIKKYLPKNPVGITARYRKTWGRNLSSLFYERLIYLLEDMGYNIVWIGEKATTLPCPLNRMDFSITKESNDLELTLALISQLKFTIQFWTASSRLAALANTPYILFESPDQIWGNVGQEGMRLNLMTREKSKRVICYYQNSIDDKLLSLVQQSVIEVENNNFNDIIGSVEDRSLVEEMKCLKGETIGDFTKSS